MPNEPEKPIEQALHAYAQRRQEEAGAPLELHPATRQVLQGEVARTLAKTAGETPSRFQFLLAAWPRLAFGGAIFATLVFVLVLLQSGNRIGPNGSRMELAQHQPNPAAEMEFRKLPEPSATAGPEAKDRDEAVPMPVARGLAQPPPKPMATDPLENINEAKVDNFARSMPPSTAAPPRPQASKPAEPANQSREEMTRQDFSFKAKSEVAGAKANETPAAPLASGNAQSLSRENNLNRQAGLKQMTETRRKPGELLDQPARLADRLASPAKPQPSMRAPEPSRLAIADEKLAKQSAPAATPAGAAGETGKRMKLAERDVKMGADKSAALLAVAPAPALPPATPAKPLANDSTRAATQLGYFYTPGGDLLLSFSQADPRAKYRQNLNSPPVPNVLTAFQIERAGNTIRIIDADGSIYAGQIFPGAAGVSFLNSDVGSVRLSDAAKKESQGKSVADNGGQRDGSAPATGFSFQAAGTNQTLNQSVEFFGTMVLDPAVAPAGDPARLAVVKARAAAPARSTDSAAARSTISAPTSGPPLNEAMKQSELPRGRIQGQAVVGGKNQFEIIAVPATK